MKRVVFRGRLISLSLERRKLPGGYVADLEVVRHPGAVLIVPFIEKNRIVLIRQYRPVISSYIWELPAGTLKPGESPMRCAKRELREETGFTARRWRKVGFIYPAPGYTTEKIHIFSATGLSEAHLCRDDDEIIEPRAFRVKEIRGMVKRGEIPDAKTICALTLCGMI